MGSVTAQGLDDLLKQAGEATPSSYLETVSAMLEGLAKSRDVPQAVRDDITAIKSIVDAVATRIQEADPAGQVKMSAKDVLRMVSPTRLANRGGDEVLTIVASARAQFAAGENLRTSTHERAWVNQVLADKGLKRLSLDEAKVLGIACDALRPRAVEPRHRRETSSSGANVNCGQPVAGKPREEIIAIARERLVQFSAQHGTAICSEKAWVSQALADAGLPRLSQAEVDKYAILTE